MKESKIMLMKFACAFALAVSAGLFSATIWPNGWVQACLIMIAAFIGAWFGYDRVPQSWK